MVRLDKSDSRCNVRLKSIVAEVYSLLTANDGKLAFKVSLAVGTTVMFGHHAQIAICIGAYTRARMYSYTRVFGSARSKGRKLSPVREKASPCNGE
jgi:hypothetical protein